MTHGIVLRVALAAPLRRLFDYLPPDDVSVAQLQPGMRLLVPFGPSKRCAVLVEVADNTDVPAGKLKSAQFLLDTEPLLQAADMEFLLWTADYYHHPAGEVIMAALPVRLRKGEKPHALSLPGWQLTAKADQLDLTALTRAPRQRAVLEYLLSHDGGASRAGLRQALGNVSQIMRSLQQKQWVKPCEIAPQASQRIVADQPRALLDEQRLAVDQVQRQLNEFCVYLLDGITGSGKTEVYLQLARLVLDRGQNVLLLVPEISLTPQLVSRFENRLPEPLSLMHSGMNETEREKSWLQAAAGQARLIIGTRSAVLVPIPNLGLVMVDEEHDLSYKQQEGFRYSARDLAIVRAQRAGCPVLLGSATPSLESLHHALSGKYRHLRLRQRAGGAQPPKVNLIDIGEQKLQGGLSPALLQALEQTLTEGRQAIVFLNRRGFAPVVSCYSCGWLSDCPRCDARQTLHAASRLLWCHHCGYQRRMPEQCPDCGSSELHPLGQGTEQLEQVLRRQFPDHPLVRIDRDSTRRKGSLQHVLEQARDGRAALLVGTQMLAKGHHFPGVALVGMLDVDGGLFGADFRAAERMAQLLIQVAGRAGRGEHPGKVLIQTRFPQHPLLQTLVHEGYEAFADAALGERREAGLPPFAHQALIRASAGKEDYPAQFLEQAAQQIHAAAGNQVAVWGPVPAPMQRRAGKYHAHLLIQSNRRAALHACLSATVAGLSKLQSGKRVRWSLDVDPMDMH